MAQPWIEELAAELKEKGREAAESYGRQLHRAGIVGVEGRIFFTALVQYIEQDIAELRGQLQGSAIASHTSALKESPTQLKLSRARFPWFEATLSHNEADIIFDYVQGRGVAPVQVPDRQTIHYSFEVDPQDRLTVTESFGENPRSFNQPEDLAQHILELLFKL